jgi:hypothetical protein
MTRFIFAAFLLSFLTSGVAVSQEGSVPTQMLVSLDAKSQAPADASAFTVEVGGRKEPLTSWQQLAPDHAQVALLIDDGLRETIGREMENLKAFLQGLPPGMEVMVGFMQYGHVVSQGFTTDHAAAANALHLPQGTPDASASPYICLSDFVHHWPGGGESSASSSLSNARAHGARIVLMISNGVDPYNGSTSVLNQDSPYVKSAVADAQRAGVAVSAIYFGDSGAEMRSASADNSGQNYLSQLAENTGGVSLWQGIGNPVSLDPFLKQFQQTLAETYIATFPAPAGHNPQDLVRVKISAPHVKLHAPSQVLPGTRE